MSYESRQFLDMDKYIALAQTSLEQGAYLSVMRQLGEMRRLIAGVLREIDNSQTQEEDK